jgi:hypothetical protein
MVDSMLYTLCAMTLQDDVSNVSAPVSGAASPAPSITELPVRVRQFLAREHMLLIGGEWIDAADGSTFETVDPATGEVLARVPAGGAADVDAPSGRHAGPSRTTPGSESGRPSGDASCGGWQT